MESVPPWSSAGEDGAAAMRGNRKKRRKKKAREQGEVKAHSSSPSRLISRELSGPTRSEE